MLPRRLLALSFLSLPGLGGCGAVATVRTAFEIPVAPTPSPRELARAKETRGFDSLSNSVAKLNADTVRKIFGATAQKPGAIPKALWQPAAFAVQPARSLASDLNRGTSVPLSPVQVHVSFAPAHDTGVSLPPALRESIRTVAARHLFSSPLGATGSGLSDAARAFLQAWAARESLRRSDEELLARRALEDRIAFQTHTAIPEVDLSLVSPETQLELSNLRLQLIPLLQVPPARRARAVAQIEAIEARLNQIWEQETARQAALLQQSLVEIPARLRREGESALSAQVSQSATRTQDRLTEVRRDLQTRLPLPSVSSLGIIQNAATSPDAVSVRAGLARVPGGARTTGSAAAVTVSGSTSEIARRGANPFSRIPGVIVAKNTRVWQQATR